jgi:hypothetical protein
MNADIGRVFGLVQGVLGSSQIHALAPNGVIREPLQVRMADYVGPWVIRNRNDHELAS